MTNWYIILFKFSLLKPLIIKRKAYTNFSIIFLNQIWIFFYLIRNLFTLDKDPEWQPKPSVNPTSFIDSEFQSNPFFSYLKPPL
jgi:hypothetical protein